MSLLWLAYTAAYVTVLCFVLIWIAGWVFTILYKDKLYKLREDAIHKYATFSNCLRTKMRTLKTIEDANATYSTAEREFLESYIAANRAGGYYSVGINNLPPTTPPNYDLTARVKMIVDEIANSAEAVNESRLAYEASVRQFNDALNDWKYRVLYVWLKGERFPRAEYAPPDEDVLSGDFCPFPE